MWLTTPGNTLNIYNFIFTPNHFFHHHNLFSIIILGHHSTSLVRLRLKEAHGLPSRKVTNRAETAPALSFNLKRTRPLRDRVPRCIHRTCSPCLGFSHSGARLVLRQLQRDVAYFLIGLCLFTCLKNKCPESWTYTLIQFCSVSSVFTNTKKYVVTSFFLRTHVQMGGY